MIWNVDVKYDFPHQYFVTSVQNILYEVRGFLSIFQTNFGFFIGML
jgi:hypothetical protein